jgi:translation initiation factor 4G
LENPNCKLDLEIFVKKEQNKNLPDEEKNWRGNRSSLFNGAWRKTVVEISPSEGGFRILKAEGVEKVIRQAKSLLNKLAPEKFEKILSQIVDLTKENIGFLDQIVFQIFEKGVNEPHFAQMYAAFSQRLFQSLVGNENAIGQSNESANVANKFRGCLIAKCQEEFESEEKTLNNLSLLEAKSAEEKEDFLMKSRRRRNGLVIFIGELYNMKFLNENAMKKCIFICINSSSAGSIPHEDEIELLCKLLTTIGDKLAPVVEKKYLSELFELIENYSHKKDAYSARIRFMLKDLIDLRNNNWMRRRDLSLKVNIEEIHKAPSVKSFPEQKSWRKKENKTKSYQRRRN